MKFEIGRVSELVLLMALHCLIAAGNLQAQNKPVRLAVGGFAGLGDDAKRIEESRLLTDLVTIELTGNHAFDLVDRSEIDRVIKESTLSISGWTKASDNLWVGKLLQADWLLMGSFMNVSGTNCVVARLVDARTGVIRDLTVMSCDGGGLQEVARRLSEFVSISPRTEVTLSRRIFIGVGGFEDLGVNNRYPELRKSIRLKLEETFRNTSVAVVERAMVNSLLTELRLNLNGLTSFTSESPDAFPSFLLIDGTYQARYEGQQQIELLLRMEAMEGAARIVKLNGAVGSELLDEVVRAVQSNLLQRAHSPAPVPDRNEALVQLERGKERARLPSAWNDVTLGGYVRGQNDGKRRQNIVEAIEAFEAALLTDPDLVEAKLYLARCLLEPDFDQHNRGRDYLREIISVQTNTALAVKARYKLAESFEKRDDTEAYRLYTELLAEARNPGEQAHLLDTMYLTVERLQRQGRLKREERMEHLRKLLWALCEAADLESKKQATTPSTPVSRDIFGLTGRLQNTYSCFTRLESFADLPDWEHMESLLSQLCARYPRWSPHILMSYAVWLHSYIHVQPSSQMVEHLALALAQGAQDPDRIPGLLSLQQQLLPAMAKWCVTNQQNSILTSVKVLRGHGQVATAAPSTIFLSRTNVPKRSVFDNSAATEPLRFSIGEPVLVLPERAVFACDGGQIWLRDGYLPAVYDIATGTITDLDWPKEVEHYVTSIAVNAECVWFGTGGSGLLELEKRTRKWRHYTEREGLILSKISALHLAGQRLWVGFGHRDAGGVGFLDLESRKFTAFTPPLNEMAADRKLPAHSGSGEAQPPRNHVHGFAEGQPGEIWMAVARVGLKCYRAETGTWSSTAMNWVKSDCLTSIVGTQRHIVLGGNGYFGGAAVLDLESHQQQGIYRLPPAIKRKVGNPPSRENRMVNSLALDGSKIWVGGMNYLAQIDLKSGNVDSLAEFGEDELVVGRVEVTTRELWIAVNNKLYRIPRTSWLAGRE